MDTGTTAIAIALMAASAIAGLTMRRGRIGAVAALASAIAMADGVWFQAVLAPVTWFAVIVALVIATGLSHRLTVARQASGFSPPRQVAASTIFGACGNLLMGVLILQAAGEGGVVVSGQMSHGMSTGAQVAAYAALIYGLACGAVAIRSAMREREVAAVIDVGAMGAAMVVMAIGMV